MATSLRDIPGATGREPGGRRRRRDPWRGLERRGVAPVLLDPRHRTARRSRGRRLGGPRWRLSTFDTFLLITGGLVVLFLGNSLWRATRVDVRVTGLRSGQALTSEAAERLNLDMIVHPTGRLSASRLTLDGQPLDAAERTSTGYRWHRDIAMAPGRHRLELTVPRPVLPASVHRWTFDVDATPPVIRARRELPRRGMHDPVHLTGQVDTDATLTANDAPVKVDSDGRFEVSYPSPPAGGIDLVATDAAGHRVTHRVAVPIRRPRVRGVHVSAAGWSTRDIRAGVLRLIAEGKINAVEIDVKDESGEVGYRSKVPMARQIGSAKNYYDLRKVVRELHARKIRVVARIVAFRDPILATWAWAHGDRSWVVQTPDGQPQGAYGGFTNFAADNVIAYNLALAKEAVDAGVDEVLWDYIRRPEGDLTQMVFPGMHGTPEEAVADFLTRSQSMLRAQGVYQGASVFGIAADRPAAVGQNVPLISRHVDYLAPMVYPSLWVPGEYRVADPARMPYDIVSRSLQDFQLKSAGTGVHITPWLQDFSLGIAYGDAQVRSQIRAAQDLNIQDWMLWSPRVRYHTRQVLGVGKERF